MQRPWYLEEDGEPAWTKHCGFFDLTAAEFQTIQDELLSQQLARAGELVTYRDFARGERPGGVQWFRSHLPLTTYDDYAPYLNNKDEKGVAPEGSHWVFTTGRGGAGKWIPYTAEALKRLLVSSVTTLLQASASRKGEVNIRGGETILNCIAPAPFLTGLMFNLLCENLRLRLLPPPQTGAGTEFKARIEAGLQTALSTGLDIVGSLPSVLVRIGELMSSGKSRRGLSGRRLSPGALPRLLRAYSISRWNRRPIMPRDIWRPTVLLSWGLDTDSYRPRIKHYWGKDPLEFYGCTEAGILGIQAFNRKGLTLVPYPAFFEFIPEEDWDRDRSRSDRQPRTVLLAELEPGKRYEVVLTSFYGMPFIRYRAGHLIKVISIGDPQTGASLPQIALVGRADQTIDIGGFTRLDERTLLQALDRCPFPRGNWMAAREISDGSPLLRFYVETDSEWDEQQVQQSLHGSLAEIDPSYRDLQDLLGLKPLRVTLLTPGIFDRFSYEKKRQDPGFSSASLPHVNPSPSVIHDILAINAEFPQESGVA
ncbi:MAG: GH3 auxin-responsive promoter family protein [Chloroflexi bacterium]|nr:GH3 auxin-responsive promoter family protein [Chloroflexota bacterium]